MFVGARNFDCSLGDMVFAARDRKMITDECLIVIIVWSSGLMIVLLVAGFFQQGP